MAIKKYNVLSNENQHVSVPFNYTRGSAMPIDNSSIWPTLSDAQNYANGTTGGYGVPFVGQLVTVNDDTGVSAYVIGDVSGTLKMLATGGTTDDIVSKLNAEIRRATAAEKEISANLSSGLSVTVERLAVPVGDDADTYVVKQGGLSVGDYISIPKDKVFESAYMVGVKGEPGSATRETISAFAVTYDSVTAHVLSDDTGTKSDDPELTAFAEGTFSSIKNAYFGKEGGDGPYLRITVSHQDTPVYIAMPKLVDTYVGGSTDTVDVRVDANTRTITAAVRTGAISADQIFAGAVTEAKIAPNAVTMPKLSSDVTDYVQWQASSAVASAADYTDVEIGKLSAELKDDVSQEASDRAEAVEAKGAVLSVYAAEQAASALTAATDYTDKEIAKLSVGDTYETKADAAAKLAEAKGYTDALSTAVDGKIQSARSDLSAYACETSSYAYGQSKSYTDSEVYALSTELKGDVSSEKTRAEAAETRIDGKIDALSGEFAGVSADHEGRITTVEDKVSKLSSAMHFKGMATETQLSTGWTGTPVPPYKSAAETPQDGDVVIRIGDSKEFVWGSSQWNELGDETGLYATKSALEAEVLRAEAAEAALVAADAEISAKTDNKIKVGEGTYSGSSLSNVDTLSVVKIADEDYYKLVAEDKQNNDVLYIVSSDFVNGHGQRVIEVGTAVSATDAVNLSGMTAAIAAAKSEIVANSLSGVTINGVQAEIVSNVAMFGISCINCGGAV